MKKKAVIGIIFNSDKTGVLLIKRRDVPVWVLPGGGVDADETPENAIIREVYEETGLVVDIKRKIGEYTPLNQLAQYTEVFECKPISGSLQTGAETKDINYFSIQQLPKAFFPVHDDWLKDALQNQEGVLKKPIWRVTYLGLFKYFLAHPLRVLRFSLTLMGFPINS